MDMSKLNLMFLASAILLIAGCGSRSGISLPPAPEICDTLVDGYIIQVECDLLVDCTSDRDCADGEFCFNGYCGSDCFSDDRCEERFAEGYTCNPRGRCLSPVYPPVPVPPPPALVCDALVDGVLVQTLCDDLEECDPVDDQCSEGTFCLNGDYNYCASQCNVGNNTCPEYVDTEGMVLGQMACESGLCVPNPPEARPSICETYDADFNVIEVDCDTLVSCDPANDLCPDGSFCLNEEYNYCAFQCTVENNICPEFYDTEGNLVGQMECNNGRCENPEELPICELVQKAVNVVFIVDRSGSMDDPFGDTTRYEAMKTALIDVSTAFPVEEAQFSAYLYWDFRSSSTCPETADAAYGEDIETLFNSTSPDGWTPTAEAVELVTSAQSGITPPGEGPTVFILATDGLPNGCGQSADHQQNSVDAVSAALTAGYETYVLGIDLDDSSDHLADLATAGGTGLPFFNAEDPDGLSESLMTIVEDAILPITCEPLTPPEDPDFGVETPPDVIEPETPELPTLERPVPPLPIVVD